MAITLDGSNVNTVGVTNVGTVQNSTSGTAVQFSGIPELTKQISMVLNKVSN